MEVMIHIKDIHMEGLPHHKTPLILRVIKYIYYIFITFYKLNKVNIISINSVVYSKWQLSPDG